MPRVIRPLPARVLAPVVIDHKEHRLKIITVVAALALVMLAGCTVVPHAGYGYGHGKRSHHHGHHRHVHVHVVPGHGKHGRR